MPQLIDFIDAIARKKGRDVLFVRFGPVDDETNLLRNSNVAGGRHDWEIDPHRIELIAWLEAPGIDWQLCGQIASEYSMSSYLGDIYLDVPFDKSDPVYQALSARLENPDETRKIPGVTFCYVPLEIAMRNAHHDEPDFWEKWAENF